MKRFFTLAFLFASLVSFAQTRTLTVQGCLSGIPSGTNPAGIQINVMFDSAANIPLQTVLTNANGCYTVSATTTGNPQYVSVWGTGCNNQPMNGFGQIVPGTVGAIVNLVYCNSTPPPCRALFTFTQNGNTIVTTNSSTSSNPSTVVYTWSFGDGTSSNLANPTHTYTRNGVYAICLNMFDTLNNCRSSFCDSVLITNATPNPPTCTPRYTSVRNGLTVNFQNTSNITNTARFIWNFGDGTTASGYNATHTYTASGVYWACLTMIDSTSAGSCRNTFCDSVRVGTVVVNCQARFNKSITGTTVSFTNTSVAAPGAMTFWSFGDGTSSNLPNPTHTYNANGVFRVCLTIADSLTGCQSTTCDSVVIGGTVTTCAISGTITVDSGMTLPNAQVRLYEITSNGVVLRRTVFSNNLGRYEFAQVPSGSYLVYAMMDTSNSTWRNYVPTYYGNSPFWFSAIPVRICPARTNVNIRLLNVRAIGRGGFWVRGRIFMGTRKVNGLGGYPVYVANANDEVVALTYTDNAGTYTIGNLPAGTYKVTVDVAGLSRSDYNVTLSTANPSADNTNFELNSTFIVAGVKDAELTNPLTLYPNPVTDQLQIQFEAGDITKLQVRVYNNVGQLISSDVKVLTGGTSIFEVPFNGMPNGIYLIQLSADGKSVTKRIVKQ